MKILWPSQTQNEKKISIIQYYILHIVKNLSTSIFELKENIIFIFNISSYIDITILIRKEFIWSKVTIWEFVKIKDIKSSSDWYDVSIWPIILVLLKK